MLFTQVGISFKNASLDVRDKVHFTDVRKMDFLDAMSKLNINQVVILSTCNRSEVFYFGEDQKQSDDVIALFVKFFGKQIKKHLELRFEEDALRYLFKVTCGMESQIVGEDQILGQVKEAADFSRTMGYSQKEMNKVFREAITLAKKMKTQLHVSDIPLSVAYVAIQQLKKKTTIKDKKVFIVGSGKTAQLSLTYLLDEKPASVTICNRTLAHAKKLQKKHKTIDVVNYGDRYEAASKCDLIVSATTSPHFVFRYNDLVVNHKMVMLDLASPRDMDPKFSKNKKVTLIDLDSLQQVVDKNTKQRNKLLNEGNKMLEESLKETVKWLNVSRIDPTIGSLQKRCDEISKDAYEYLTHKIDLGERERHILKLTLDASLTRVMKEPITQLKKMESNDEQASYEKMIKKLFKLDED